MGHLDLWLWEYAEHLLLSLHLQGVATLLWTTNAKLVGTIYLGTSLAFGISGLLMS